MPGYFFVNNGERPPVPALHGLSEEELVRGRRSIDPPLVLPPDWPQQPRRPRTPDPIDWDRLPQSRSGWSFGWEPGPYDPMFERDMPRSGHAVIRWN
jgi:hypothetical protein